MLQNFSYDASFFLFAGDLIVYQCQQNQVPAASCQLPVASSQLPIFAL
jgi:hypothetical protein